MGRLAASSIDRFLSYASKNPNTGCWDWIGHLDKDGYGFFYDKKNVRAHRWSYQYHVKAIPSGMTVDHLCRNKGCVNPDHLEIVTNKENILRGKDSRNCCRKGHLYSEHGFLNSKGWKSCKLCKSDTDRKYYQKKKLIIEKDKT